MGILKDNLLGLYEKALPLDMDWDEKFATAQKAGYDYIELSIDGTPERLCRLNWTDEQIVSLRRMTERHGMPFYTMALTANRAYPLGDFDENVRETGVKIVKQAIDLAAKLGIRLIQLAAYDVYGQQSNATSDLNFIQSLARCTQYAAQKMVMLSLELMDAPYADTCEKLLRFLDRVRSPFLQIYYDIGNAVAVGRDNVAEIKKGGGHIVCVHVKDALPGCCRNVRFGTGAVDFAACFAALDGARYAGPVVAEMWSNDDRAFLPYLPEAARFIRGELEKQEG